MTKIMILTGPTLVQFGVMIWFERRRKAKQRKLWAEIEERTREA